MISLGDAIAQYKSTIAKPTFKSERAELLSQLYQFYEEDYKIQKWKEYVGWLKQNRKKHSLEMIEEYKRISFKKISLKTFCSYWLSHIPTDDLYYLVSFARDKHNRKESFNRWLFYNLKVR